jgi:molybdate transport system permease protein
MSELLPTLMLSLRVALAATVLTALVGVPLAFVTARRRFVGKSLLDAILTIPLVLPPTVVGYILVILLGSRGPIGRATKSIFGTTLLFTEPGAVLAAAVVALPLLYLPARAAFASIDPEFDDLARLMGASHRQMFWHVSLPLAARGIASGLLLAFARALGEFGATMMVFGQPGGRRTLPISIYNNYVGDDMAQAAPAVVALSAVSLAVLVIYNHTLGAKVK